MGFEEETISVESQLEEWSGGRVEGAIRSLVNGRDLQLVCASLA